MKLDGCFQDLTKYLQKWLFESEKLPDSNLFFEVKENITKIDLINR